MARACGPPSGSREALAADTTNYGTSSAGRPTFNWVARTSAGHDIVVFSVNDSPSPKSRSSRATGSRSPLSQGQAGWAGLRPLMVKLGVIAQDTDFRKTGAWIAGLD